MVPWGEILECDNLDIWILVLDLKNKKVLCFPKKIFTPEGGSRKQSLWLLNDDLVCYLLQLR